MKVVERVITVKAAKSDREKDLAIWKWLLELMRRLGSDGMSSDESDIEDLRTVYRVKILIWRRNIDRYVEMIDNERKLAGDIFSKAGAKATPRIRSDQNPVSTRDAPANLPSAIFDPDWLKTVDDDYQQMKLNISRENFKWIVFSSGKL